MNKYLPLMESDTYAPVSALLPFNEALSSIRSHGYRNIQPVLLVVVLIFKMYGVMNSRDVILITQHKGAARAIVFH